MALRFIGMIALLLFPAVCATASGGTAPVQVIAFASDRGCVPQGANIYLMDADGSNVVPLTQTCLESDPAWSPDGAQIAFISRRDGAPALFVMNADGGDAHRVTPVGVFAERPSWSQRGQIAFDSLPGIETIKPDGSGLTRLTADGYDPSWSPDGSRIAFSLNNAATNRVDEVETIAADGTNLQQVALGVAPAFSPDGKHLAWAGRRAADGAATLVVANADGSNPQTIVTITPSTYTYDLAPAWSPDSTTLTYDAGPNAEIYRVSATGGTPQRLTVSASSDTTSAWRPMVPSTGLVIARVVFARRACATRPGRATTTVVDGQGRALPNATVTIQGLRAKTNASGAATLTLHGTARHHGRLYLTVRATLTGRPAATKRVSLPACH
ncbi:MAG: TolB family protein [Gaiellaceae bacterium]